MTDEKTSEMIAALQANSIAMQIMMVAMLETLNRKGLLSLADIHDTGSIAMQKLDRAAEASGSDGQWVFSQAKDRISQIFPAATQSAH